MIILPAFNPYVFELTEGIGLRWYGLMYLLGFWLAWCLGKRRLHEVGLDVSQFSDLIAVVALGIIVGGRIGYVLFYQWSQWVQEPWLVFMLWRGGMSFHGALVGGLAACIYFANTLSIRLFSLLDFVVVLLPPGLLLGRLGNFINGELWGRVSDMPWAMVFPHSDLLPRHPSQLYEMFGEGVLLYMLLSYHRRTAHADRGQLAMWFVVHYAWIRFFIEFYREPDSQLGFVWLDYFTMGQVLCLGMLLTGILMLLWDRYNFSRQV